MSNMYERIERLSKGRGLNVTQMCKDAGIARAVLSDYKTGRKKMIGTANLQKLADYFDVTIDYLLTGETQKEKAPAVVDEELMDILDEMHKRPEQKALFSLSKRASKEDIEAVSDLLKHMIGESED